MSATVNGQRTIEGLHRLRAGIEEAARAILFSATAAAQTHAQSTTLFQDRTGQTRGSIKATLTPTSGKVVAKGAARFLESGTRPHMIEAKSGGMLRFFVSGQEIFRRSVQHPGTSPRPFMMQARLHAEHVIAYAAEVYVGEAIARA